MVHRASRLEQFDDVVSSSPRKGPSQEELIEGRKQRAALRAQAAKKNEPKSDSMSGSTWLALIVLAGVLFVALWLFKT